MELIIFPVEAHCTCHRCNEGKQWCVDGIRFGAIRKDFVGNSPLPTKLESTSRDIFVVVDGVEMPLSDWEEKIGIGVGWGETPEKAERDFINSVRLA